MHIPFNEATREQLFDYATNVLGLDVGQGTNNSRLIELIRKTNSGAQGIDVEATSEPIVRSAEITGPGRKAYSTDPTIEVNVNNQEGRGGDRPVPVSVNGDQILIRRNEWVKIPYRFYLAMMNAVQTTYEPITNDVGKMVDQKAIDQLAFPFNSRNGPSQAELDQWAKAKQAESARVAKEKQEERRMAARLRKAAEEMEAA